MLIDLFTGDLAQIAQALCFCVILCELLKFPAADKINPAIANVSHYKLIFFGNGRQIHGGKHAVGVKLPICFLKGQQHTVGAMERSRNHPLDFRNGHRRF